MSKKASIPLKPVITYSPEKIGDAPAEKFVLPANRALTYTVSDTALAEVAADGTVTTKEAGICTVTITTVNGKNCRIALFIDTVIPSKIVITCSDSSDKMYLNEELTFTAKSVDSNGNEDPKLLQKVTWSVDNALFNITADGKLTCKYPADYSLGSVTVTATSTANNAISASKTITVCKNIADIEAVSCVDADKNDQTNYLMRTKGGGSVNERLLPQVNITLKNDVSYTCREFVISEKTEFSGDPSSDYLDTAVYKDHIPF